MNAPVTPRRAIPVETVPLPAAVLTALRSIREELRNIPRACLLDRAEMVHWINRQARRIEGVAAMTVPVGHLAPPKPTAPRLRAITALDAAEAVFGGAGTPTASAVRQTKPRTVKSARGRSVRVEARRRWVHENQLRLWDA